MPGVKTNERPGTRAVLRHSRMSAFKAREVLDLIRGVDYLRAAEILEYSERGAAQPIGKLLRSAAANAQNNEGLDAEELYVAACYADEGTTIKRWRPRARGRATRIRKRTCHITIILARLADEEIARRRARLAAEQSERRARRVAGTRRSRRQAEDVAAEIAAETSAEAEQAAAWASQSETGEEKSPESSEAATSEATETALEPEATEEPAAEPVADEAPVAEEIPVADEAPVAGDAPAVGEAPADEAGEENSDEEHK